MYKKSFSRLFLLALFSSALLLSCDKDFNEIGTDIVGDEHFSFEKYTGASVKSYNQKIGATASNNLPVNLLGFYTNPAFGTTQANFVTQVEMAVNNVKFNNVDPEAYDVLPTVLDSVILEIPYYCALTNVEEVDVAGVKERRSTYKLDSVYGVDESKFKLSVYQSNYFLRNLDPDQSLGQQQLFYTDQDVEIDANKIPTLLNNLPTSDPRNADGRENNQFFFDKREHKTIAPNETAGQPDVKTRTPPSMRLHLRNDVFAAAILNATPSQLADNTVFKNYFRGIYFKTESIGNPGNMATLNFGNGKITLYYNEDKKTTPATGPATYTREKKNFVLNLKGNTISLLRNTNENSDYLNATNNNTTEASQLFVKGGQGSVAVIDVFGADANNNGIADEIEVIKANGWLINEANLTFYVDKPAMSDSRTIEPNRVFLYDLTNKRLLIDYIFDRASSTPVKNDRQIFGGFLEKESGANGRGRRYKIRITDHVRNLIKNDSTNVRLGLSVTEDINISRFSRLRTANSITNSIPLGSVVSPLGTILYGSSPLVADDKRLKLEIYYTKPE